jgi:hypothetical protein
MSKGSRGNKKAKKPKRVMPVVRSPTTGTGYRSGCKSEWGQGSVAEVVISTTRNVALPSAPDPADPCHAAR